jgi:hypothetical protein
MRTLLRNLTNAPCSLRDIRHKLTERMDILGSRFEIGNVLKESADSSQAPQRTMFTAVVGQS